MPPRQETQESKPGKGSRISNAEWGLVIGAVICIDLIQIALDLLMGAGVAVNRFIDIFVGMTLPFYFHLRGVKLDTKKLLSIAASFVGEEIPVIDAAPLWTIDVLMIMSWDKADKKLPSLPI